MHAYARALILRHHYLPYEAACEAWDVLSLHGGDRQAFIDAVEAAHITPTETEETTP